MDSLVIGSRLDTEVNANACRLAFSGRLVARYDAKAVSILFLCVGFILHRQYAHNSFNVTAIGR